jgi:hypothetical protein
MEKHIKLFDDLIKDGDAMHGSPYRAFNKGALPFKEHLRLREAIKAHNGAGIKQLNITTLEIAAKYAGKTVTITVK